MNPDMLKAAGTALGVILAIPAVMTLIKFSRFLSHIEATAESTEKKLDAFMVETRAMILAHDRDIVDIKAQLRWGRRSSDKHEEIENAG